MKEQVLDLLCELSGCDEPKENLDVRLFDEGLIDSFGIVNFLLELENLGVEVPISEFDREQWATPNMILEHLTSLKEA